MKRPLEDNVAIVTDGGTGIGEAICRGEAIAFADDLANIYAFLASDAASFVTGALCVVDGRRQHGEAGDGQAAAIADPAASLAREHAHEEDRQEGVGRMAKS